MKDGRWVSMGQAAAIMRCHRGTVYRRLRRLEEKSGRQVIVARPQHNGVVKMFVRKADVDRAARAMGAVVQDSEIKDLRDDIELLQTSVRILTDRVDNVLMRLAHGVAGVARSREKF
jgi:hypothetical protein